MEQSSEESLESEDSESVNESELIELDGELSQVNPFSDYSESYHTQYTVKRIFLAFSIIYFWSK